MNVILITISTLRADHVGCLGCDRDTTPNFDDMAAEGILFRNAFAASGWMMPAHGSIFTSLYPARHGATHIDKSLSEECETIAEILNSKGYHCAGFCCGPQLDADHGFAQGFELYDDYSVRMMLETLAFDDDREIDINKRRTNDLINDAAIRWLRKNTRRPYFLFVHYYDNHWDYLPPEPYDRLYDREYEGPIDGSEIAREPLFSNRPQDRDIAHMIALYDGEVTRTDRDLGEMLGYFRANRIFENSIVFIVADHGEQFYEHGHTSHHGVYEELIHIPMAVSIPQVRSQPKVIDALVSQLDILPTILDYLDIPVGDACRGKSLRPLIEGRATAVNESVFVEYAGGAAPDTAALRSLRYKYFQVADSEPFAYDLAADPGERQKILQADFTEEIKVLKDSLERLMKSTNYSNN